MKAVVVRMHLYCVWRHEHRVHRSQFLYEDVHLCPASTKQARTESLNAKITIEGKRRSKAGGLLLPSNVHMKATILVLYQRRQLYNCTARNKSEKSHRLLMEKCQVLWKFIKACYSNVREMGDTFAGKSFRNCWSVFLLVVCSTTPSVTEAKERRILGLMNDELVCVCVCVCVWWVCVRARVWKKAVVA